MTTSKQFEERYIGNGARGQVYELIGHEPPAVIKYMFRGNEEQLKNFKNECEALKKINHDNVVRFYRYTEEEIRVGMAMEYCEKGPLKGVIFDPTITYSMNTVLTWGIQLFDAIDHMYQKHGIIHRDIKPGNIFVNDGYQLKIGDFGLVKVVRDGTVTGTSIGTQRYMSPPDMKDDGVRDVYEQMKDVSDSHRNDVYSLGLVMWEIIERKTIFTNYEISEEFERDLLLIDIALKRLTEIESPECQSEIQKIILRCTNFQRIHRPAASEVSNFLAQTQKAKQFISSLPFMPTEDENQKELTKPIGFDDKTDWVMVESEERKYAKRFEAGRLSIFGITKIMRDKLGRLISAEREKFFKEAPNIVSRLKEETQTFKDARYVIQEILKIEEGKENLHEKDLYEIFELFVLEEFEEQVWAEGELFQSLKSREEIWITSFDNWRRCEPRINYLKQIKREKYTTNFYFRCFISQLTGEGWIHIESYKFVSEDLKLWKGIPGQWVDNLRTEIRSYEIKNEDKRCEVLHFSHYKQIPLERIIEAFDKQKEKMEIIIKLHLKFLIPIEDSEKNNVPFNIVSLLDKTSASKRSYWLPISYGPHPMERMVKHLIRIEDSEKNSVQFNIEAILDESSADKRSSDTESTSESGEEYERYYGPNYEPYPFPHYIFQLRNPPRSICQKNHSGECQMDGFRKMERCSGLPKELHIPVCGEVTKNLVWFLESYIDCIRSNGDLIFFSKKQEPFLFLCCQNLLDIPFLILLDHPNNYENGESVPGLDFKTKIHNIDVGVLREYFEESKLNERVYALIECDLDLTPHIRLIDYQGNPKTEWLEFWNVPKSASYSQFSFLTNWSL